MGHTGGTEPACQGLPGSFFRSARDHINRAFFVFCSCTSTYNSKRIRRVRNQSVGKRLLEGQIHCDRTGGPGTFTYMTPRCLTSSGVVVLRLVHKPLANR
jgi:hypothetical protein